MPVQQILNLTFAEDVPQVWRLKNKSSVWNNRTALQLRFLMGQRFGFAFNLLLLKADRRGTEAHAETDFQCWGSYKTLCGGLRGVSKMPKQAKKERDKEGSSASFNLFLSGEATLVWTWISGEGKGGLTVDKTAFQGNPAAGRCHLPPSICRHRAFLSDILSCSSGCLLERTLCRSISQQ